MKTRFKNWGNNKIVQVNSAFVSRSFMYLHKKLHLRIIYHSIFQNTGFLSASNSLKVTPVTKGVLLQGLGSFGVRHEKSTVAYLYGTPFVGPGLD